MRLLFKLQYESYEIDKILGQYLFLPENNNESNIGQFAGFLKNVMLPDIEKHIKERVCEKIINSDEVVKTWVKSALLFGMQGLDTELIETLEEGGKEEIEDPLTLYAYVVEDNGIINPIKLNRELSRISGSSSVRFNLDIPNSVFYRVYDDFSIVDRIVESLRVYSDKSEQIDKLRSMVKELIESAKVSEENRDVLKRNCEVGLIYSFVG